LGTSLSGFSALCHWSVSFSTFQDHIALTAAAKGKPWHCVHWPSHLILLLQVVLAIGFFVFPHEFRIILPVSTKCFAGVLTGAVLNLCTCLGRARSFLCWIFQSMNVVYLFT
jgi:hypothetical protein